MSLNSIVSDVRFHDEFNVVGKDNKPAKGPKAAAAAAAPASNPSRDVNRDGKVWNNPFEWLAKIKIDSVKRCWKRALLGDGICPICHREENRHAPASCPFLAELNLKLIKVAPAVAAKAPLVAPAPAPLPSPGGRSAVTDETSASSSTGSSNAPSGLMATVADTVADEYDSGDEY